MTIKEYVQLKKEEIKSFVDGCEVKPHLAIIQVNEDAGSNAYVKGKIKDSNELGITADLFKFDTTISQEELLKEVEKLNNNPAIDGFIVQMPLPSHIDQEAIKLAISPEKDVDGFHPLSKLNPCTPQGIINYLHANDIKLQGLNALVIGRSNIVGKPMAKLLLADNCNVTVVHSKTSKEDMARYIANADIIVIAIGKMHFLNDSFKYKESAIIIDVGISRDETGLHGDAQPNLPVMLQTPVPGGVGLVTRVTLLDNLLKIYKEKYKI